MKQINCYIVRATLCTGLERHGDTFNTGGSLQEEIAPREIIALTACEEDIITGRSRTLKGGKKRELMTVK